MKIERKAKKATERFGVTLIWASGIGDLKSTSFYFSTSLRLGQFLVNLFNCQLFSAK